MDSLSSSHHQLQKNKYMIISSKSPSFSTSISPLFLNGSQLEHVNSFEYFGVIITFNLSWSSNIQSVHSKARQIIGIIYCNFYKHASPQSLLTFYHSLVIPYFTYCMLLCLGPHPYLLPILKILKKNNTLL